MTGKSLASAAALGLALFAFDSSAQVFRIKIEDYGSSNTDFREFVDSEMRKIEKNINKGLPKSKPDRILEGSANSSVFAGKGVGSDYASGMEAFMVGAAVGVGADLAEDPETKAKASGFGLAPSLVLGANLGFIKRPILGLDPRRMNAYFNFMSYNYNHKLDDGAKASLGMKNMGMHLNYQWLAPKGNSLFNWGGVTFHTGYEYNRTDIQFSTKISESVTATSSGTGDTINGTVSGNPKASIVARTHSIPLEVSTSIQTLYFLSLYTGLGTDISWGEASAKADLNSESSDINCSGGVACTPGSTVVVKPEANITGNGEVDQLQFRGFLGVQFNVPFVRVFVQVDKALGSELIGGTAGLRLVY